MIITDQRYRLPADVEQVIMDDDEVLLTRRGSRVPPQLVSADAMALLEQFRDPTTLADAVLRYCAAVGADPLITLDEAFGVLVALTRSDVLVADGTDAATDLADRHHVGERVGPAVITERIRVLRDSEVWRGLLDDATPVVIKIVDQPVVGPDLVTREVAALTRLRGSSVPDLVWHESTPTGGSLVIAAVDGDPVDLAALTLDESGRRRLALAVLDAYVTVHDHQVLHGDVHPGNLLVTTDASGHPTVTMIDFGLAAVPGWPAPPRISAGEQLDPQAAAATSAGEDLPDLDPAAEQYAIAATLFRVLTGTAHLDLHRERAEALSMIISSPPRRFVTVGARPWPAGEQLVRRALSEDPQRRFGSVRELRDAYAAALTPDPSIEPGIDPEDQPGLDDRLRRAVTALDVTGAVWSRADADEAAHVRWFLARVASLTGDVLARDLADAWAFHPAASADVVGVLTPAPRLAVSRGHRALADHVRTGRGRSLRSAVRLAEALLASGPGPTGVRVDVRTGPWAGLLLALETRRPALAMIPGAD